MRSPSFGSLTVVASVLVGGCTPTAISTAPASTPVSIAPASRHPEAPTIGPASSSIAIDEPAKPSAAPDPPTPTVDPELARVEALIAGLPHRKIREAEVCALIAARGFEPPKTLVVWAEDGTLRLAPADDSWSGRRLVPRCESPGPIDTTEKLTPLVECDDHLPRCTFYLVSGGRKGTPLPPSERTYWFDTRAGKLVMVVVALPRFQ
jgi:hypothetical protein